MASKHRIARMKLDKTYGHKPPRSSGDLDRAAATMAKAIEREERAAERRRREQLTDWDIA